MSGTAAPVAHARAPDRADGARSRDRSRPAGARSACRALDVPEAHVPAEHARAGAGRRCPRSPSATSSRHYTRLSQMNYGVDTGIYPLGSCTMKYNPKVAETVAALPGSSALHPLQPDAHGRREPSSCCGGWSGRSARSPAWRERRCSRRPGRAAS